MIETLVKLVDVSKELSSKIKDMLPEFAKDLKPETDSMEKANSPLNNDVDYTNQPDIESGSDIEKDPVATYKERIDQTPINNGSWTGDRGDSKFIPDDPIVQEALKKNGIDGIEYKQGYPDFSPTSIFDAQLPDDKLDASNVEQKKECIQQLKDAIQKDPELAGKFTPDQLERIENGITPKGYVWHHDIEPGKMQLVPESIHQKFGHYGGQYVWAGGTENR
ncbi:HNH endonuclease [Paenibacillus sp. N3.4]|uniref:HNH endonuclease n=1 Tax=Paenibacillus sp. N3.4 TaxID=2603222 RepID=UPI0011C8D41D|nr:HNH endonuclease [Paenibacillus sp. N3.4]TXK82565.1 HNH endonuclease [Paenibacillus sp. N3.4]